MINGHRGFVEGERGEGFWEESLMSLTYMSYSHWLLLYHSVAKHIELS